MRAEPVSYRGDLGHLSNRPGQRAANGHASQKRRRDVDLAVQCVQCGLKTGSRRPTISDIAPSSLNSFVGWQEMSPFGLVGLQLNAQTYAINGRATRCCFHSE